MNDVPNKKPDYFKPPARATAACARFVDDFSELIFFVVFVGELADKSDNLAKAAFNVALHFEFDSEKRNQWEASLSKKIGAGKERFFRHRKLIAELMLCRGVDNFLTYLSELLALIFKTKPNALKSGQQVPLDVVLDHRSMDEFIDVMAEQRVHQLSYKSISDLSDELQKKLKFKVFKNVAAKSHVSRLVEMRNLIVHNRGVVNRKYIRNVGEPAELGASLQVGDRVLDWLIDLSEIVYDIDTRAARKFSLEISNTSEAVQILSDAKAAEAQKFIEKFELRNAKS